MKMQEKQSKNIGGGERAKFKALSTFITRNVIIHVYTSPNKSVHYV